ncbi:hypothetical protein HanRHA438_Chr08g0341631 [Helianthus annuus]|nr:hypothetical protein HanRHA438_Chr08g0341631 [Helianthus annuus]
MTISFFWRNVLLHHSDNRQRLHLLVVIEGTKSHYKLFFFLLYFVRLWICWLVCSDFVNWICIC